MNKLNNDIIKKNIAIACAFVFVTTLLLSYSAYAWFVMSREIEATGKNVTVNASNGLEISTDENGEYSDHIDISLKEVIEADPDVDGFDADKDDFYLMPSSSFDGTNLWYTTMTNSTGVALCNEDEFQKGYKIKYNSSSQKYEGHYVDITFWIRSSDQNPCDIYLNNSLTTIVPNGEDAQNLKDVVRMAFLDVSGENPSDESSEPLVFSNDDSKNLSVVTDNSLGVSTLVSSKYISFGSDSLSNRKIISMDGAEYDSGFKDYAKATVKVRIWIEGQDPKCVASIGGKSFNATIGLVAENN